MQAIGKYIQTSYTCFRDGILSLRDPEILKVAISRVAFFIFNLFAFVCSPVMWMIGAGIGVLFRHEIKDRITNFFGSIIWGRLSWQLVPPSALLVYWIPLPATIMVQAVLAGAAFSSHIALAAESAIRDNTNFYGQVLLKA